MSKNNDNIFALLQEEQELEQDLEQVIEQEQQLDSTSKIVQNQPQSVVESTILSRPKDNPWGVKKDTDVNVSSNTGTSTHTRSFDIKTSPENNNWTSVTKKKISNDRSNDRSYGSQDDRSYGRQRDARSYGRQDTRSYGRQDARSYGRHDTRSYGSQDARSYGSQDARSYGRQKNDNSHKSYDKVGSTKSVGSVGSVESVESIKSTNLLEASDESLSPQQNIVTRTMNIPDDKQTYASMAIKPSTVSLDNKSDKFEKKIEKNVESQVDAIKTRATKTFSTVPQGKPPILGGTPQKLPDHYTERDTSNMYQVHFTNNDLIRKIAGIEKSADIQSMYRSIVICTIEFYSNPEYMMKNTFFREKMSMDQEQQEYVFLLALIQTISLLVHRLIRSDSIDNIRMIFENLPLFDVLRTNPIENTKYSNSTGAIVFQSIKRKWINDMRVINGISKSTDSKPETISISQNRISRIKRMMYEHLLQSEWNGNNLVHSAMYYGSSKTMSYLLQIAMEKKMHVQLNKMLTVRNLIGESFNEIIQNGRTTAESQDKKMFMVKRKGFDECARLYTISIHTLREHFDSLVEQEANEILGIETENKSTDIAIPEELVETFEVTNQLSQQNQTSQKNDFDDTNIIELLTSCNIEGMIDHIIKYHKLGKLSVIKTTFNIWETVIKSQPQYEEYLSDVKDFTDIQQIIIEVFGKGQDINVSIA